MHPQTRDMIRGPHRKLDAGRAPPVRLPMDYHGDDQAMTTWITPGMTPVDYHTVSRGAIRTRV